MTSRYAIRWDKGRQQWICTDLTTFKRVGAFDRLSEAETWILERPDEPDVVLDLAELDPERAS